jgi:hypothetical protein
MTAAKRTILQCIEANRNTQQTPLLVIAVASVAALLRTRFAFY